MDKQLDDEKNHYPISMFGSSTPRDQITKVRDLTMVMRDLRESPRNWSGNEVAHPSKIQFSTAQSAIITIVMLGAPVPKIILSDDGTFGAYWNTLTSYTSIDFDADGEFPWIVALNGAGFSGIWRWADCVLPIELLKHLGTAS